MTTRLAIENVIVAELDAKLPRSQVENYPDNIRTFKPKKNNCILVGYAGKSSENNDNRQASRQRNRSTIVLTFMYATRRNRDGLLNDLDIAEKVLSGFKIGTQYLRYENDEFTGFKDEERQSERWLYTMTFTLFEQFDNTDFDLIYLKDGNGNYLVDENGVLLTQ